MEQSSISSDLIRGHIDTIILYTLIDTDKYAQQISDAIALKSDNKYEINQATLYSSLKRLENLKYITSYWNDANDGRRKFFKITETGIKATKDNVETWSVSRVIIDKLMNCPNEENNEQNSVSYEQNSANYTNNEQNSNSNDKDLNFRTVLNDLISVEDVEEPKQEIENIKSEIIEEITNENQEIDNSSIENIQVISDEIQENLNIDFSDMILNAEQEGYKLRVSSRESLKQHLINYGNVNLISAFIVFIISCLEFLLIGKKCIPSFLTGGHIALFCGILFVFPLIFTYLTIFKKNYKNFKINGDRILTSSIIVFNCLILLFALNFIFNTDFNNLSQLAVKVFYPLCICFDAIIFFILQFTFIKYKKI